MPYQQSSRRLSVKGMGSMPKISVIVPVYNKGLHLSAALDSLLAQTFEDMEILCIDDGSVDSSPLVLRQYAERDKRIRVMRHDNAGVSVTRNRGIDEARGEYIFFLDADDMLVPCALEHLYNKAKECDLDGVYFEMQLQRGHPYATDAQERYLHFDHSYEEISSGPELMRAYVENREYIVPAVRALYRRAFLDEVGLRFIPGIMHEDNAFTFMFMVQARRVTQLSEVLYLRFFVDNSIMTSAPSAAHLRGAIIVLEELITFLKGRAFDEKTEFAIRRALIPIENKIVNLIKTLPDHELVRLLTARDLSERVMYSRYIMGSVKPNRYDALISYGDIKLSVIVTSHDDERRVCDCMDSLLGQTLSDIEILCVDCGSSDHTMDIVKQYAEKDNRVILLNSECASASQARSMALESARGDYVYFIDACDFLDPDALLFAYIGIREGGYDVTVSMEDCFDPATHSFQPISRSIASALPNKSWFNAAGHPDAVFSLIPDVRGKLYSKKRLRACSVLSALPALMMSEKIAVPSRGRATYHHGCGGSEELTPISQTLRERFLKTAEALRKQPFSEAESRNTWDALCALLPERMHTPLPMPVPHLAKELSAPAVSVILPVYNIARYLPECIDSLQAQTFTDFEMIFVDDESTDESVDIIKRYVETDGRIHILKQQHRSAGAARNLGMRHARGKYLMFLDPDDFYAPKMIASAYARIEAKQAEICVFGFNRYDDATKKAHHDLLSLRTQYCPVKDVFSGDDPDADIFYFCYGMPWNKVYLHSFIAENNLEFMDQHNTNDEYFVRMAYALAKRITILENKYLVYYRFNTAKSLQDTKHLAPLCFYNAELKLYHDLSALGLFDKHRDSFMRTVAEGLHRAFVAYAGHYDAFETTFDTLMNGGFEKLGIAKDLPEKIIHQEMLPLYKAYCEGRPILCIDFYQRYSKFAVPEPRPLPVKLNRITSASDPVPQQPKPATHAQDSAKHDAPAPQPSKAEESEDYKVKYEQAQEEIKELRASESFRIGCVVTAPMRALKGILQKLRS